MKQSGGGVVEELTVGRWEGSASVDEVGGLVVKRHTSGWEAIGGGGYGSSR